MALRKLWLPLLQSNPCAQPRTTPALTAAGPSSTGGQATSSTPATSTPAPTAPTLTVNGATDEPRMDVRAQPRDPYGRGKHLQARRRDKHRVRAVLRAGRGWCTHPR